MPVPIHESLPTEPTPTETSLIPDGQNPVRCGTYPGRTPMRKPTVGMGRVEGMGDVEERKRRKKLGEVRVFIPSACPSQSGNICILASTQRRTFQYAIRYGLIRIY